MSLLEFLLSLSLGIGLAAACGFRVFLPMLGLSLASLSGHLQLASGFEWIGTWPALACFAVATTLEVTAYYVPWLDNLLDTIATPAAFVAGTVMVAATLGIAPNPSLLGRGQGEGLATELVPVATHISPLLRWTLALIAGGSMAGLIQLGTVGLRGTSTLTTGGIANFLVSTLELLLAIAATFLAIALPVACVFIATGIGAMLLSRRIGNRKRRELGTAKVVAGAPFPSPSGRGPG